MDDPLRVAVVDGVTDLREELQPRAEAWPGYFPYPFAGTPPVSMNPGLSRSTTPRTLVLNGQNDLERE